MSVPIPADYIHNESGKIVSVTEVTAGMSLIGPDYFDMGELTRGHYVIDFPDGHVYIVSPETLNTEYTTKPTRDLWTSPDSARSFAMEMQYALDHPEEQEPGCPFTQAEISKAKAYIRSAKNYLAECDESL